MNEGRLGASGEKFFCAIRLDAAGIGYANGPSLDDGVRL